MLKLKENSIITVPCSGRKSVPTCTVVENTMTIVLKWLQKAHSKPHRVGKDERRGEAEGEGTEWWMLKWQEEIGQLIVLWSGPSDLGRVRSQGLSLPRAQHCQGNCAMILTSHCLNPPSIPPLSTPLSFFNCLFPSLKLKRGRDLLSALMMSAPQRWHLSAESQHS